MRWILLAWLLLGLSSCARVRPYERETLAHPQMRASPWPEVELAEEHMRDVREGTGGANGSRGGGCGCN